MQVTDFLAEQSVQGLHLLNASTNTYSIQNSPFCCSKQDSSGHPLTKCWISSQCYVHFFLMKRVMKYLGHVGHFRKVSYSLITFQNAKILITQLHNRKRTYQ